MAVIRTAEFGEGVEEVIMRGHSGRRYETAHREGVHERVEKMLVSVRGCSRDVAICAVRLCRGGIGSRWWSGKGKRCNVYTKMVFRSGTNPRFGVYRAAQVIVQVRAFG